MVRYEALRKMIVRMVGMFLAWMLLFFVWELFRYLAPGFDDGTTFRDPLATRLKRYVIWAALLALVSSLVVS